VKAKKKFDLIIYDCANLIDHWLKTTILLLATVKLYSSNPIKLNEFIFKFGFKNTIRCEEMFEDIICNIFDRAAVSNIIIMD
jgi:hypothetical protein